MNTMTYFQNLICNFVPEKKNLLTSKYYGEKEEKLKKIIKKGGGRMAKISISGVGEVNYILKKSVVGCFYET